MSATTYDLQPAAVPAAEVSPVGVQRRARRTRHAAPSAGHARHPLILVAEPDPALAGPLTGALGRAGYDVSWAPDGEYALHALATSVPDAVLLDLNLPRVSAHRLLSVLRHSEETQHLPVVVLTALDFQEARDVVADRPDDLIAKPAPPSLVAERIGRLLGRKDRLAAQRRWNAA